MLGACGEASRRSRSTWALGLTLVAWEVVSFNIILAAMKGSTSQWPWTLQLLRSMWFSGEMWGMMGRWWARFCMVGGLIRLNMCLDFFTSNLGKMNSFWRICFQMGWNHHLGQFFVWCVVFFHLGQGGVRFHGTKKKVFVLSDTSTSQDG